MATSTLHARFDAKWMPEPSTGCFLWLGLRNEHGYGRFRVGGRLVLSHRFAWERSNGRTADGQVVRHRCDTPACVNPDHLIAGSIADNVRDRDERGRTARGRHNGRAELNEEAVREIRRRLLGESQASIAHRYGVNARVIFDIKHGRLWGHVS